MSGKRMTRAGACLALLVVVTACSRGEPNLMHIERGQTSPDEFAILPTKPIEIPTNLSELPPPTPGAGNRTDVNPQADAVVALGGSAARTQRDGQVTGDAALIRQSTRYGVQPNIRTELAVQDLQFRRQHRGRLLERWFKVPTYYNAYRPQELDQTGTLWRWRGVGAPTPAAPPEGVE